MAFKLSADELLFVACAVDTGLVSPVHVARASAKKAHQPSKTIGELLEADNAIGSEQRQRIEQLVRYELGDGGETLVEEPAGEERITQTDGAAEEEDDFDGETDPMEEGSTQPAVRLFDDTGTRVTTEQADRYQRKSVHATGGQARVLIAFDEHIGREVAIKEFVPGQVRPSTRIGGALPAVVRFLREARVTGQLEHPNIVPVHELGKREDGSLYYTMRLVRGETLEDKLEKSRTLADRLKLLAPFFDVCNALAFAHSRGVVHRDIKPENVMVGEFGETVVLDWGVAKVTGKRDLRAGDIRKQLKLLESAGAGTTLEGTTIGTPSYMSPEQASGEIDSIDERSDVWGLGAMLYEILTGNPPYKGKHAAETIRKVRDEPLRPVGEFSPEASSELAAVAQKALRRERGRRYPNAHALAEEVGAYMTGGRVRAYTYSAWDLLKRFASKHKAAFTGTTLAVLAIIAALVAVSVMLQREHAERRLAHYHLAQAYAQKADRLMEEHRLPSARVLASASLLHNPAHPLSPYHAPGFAERFPQSLELVAEAASTIYEIQRRPTMALRQVLVTEGQPSQVAFAPDGRRLAVGCHDATILLWDATTGMLERRLTGHDKKVHGIAFSPDGSLLASASYDRTLSLWDVASGKHVRKLTGHEDAVTRVAFSPDGAQLASASFDGTVRIWEVATGASVRVLAGHTGRVRAVEFSPDGRLLASSGIDMTIRIWDAASGEPLRKLPGHTNSVTRIRFTPDGRRLASAGYDGKIRLWDPETGKPLATLEGHDGHVYSLAFSPDGRWLASGGFDTAVRLWDVTTGGAFLRLHAHAAAVGGLAFSPDGVRLATCGHDKRIKVWEINPGKPGPELSGHADKIYAMDLSPDGKTIATGSWDRTVRIWDLAQGQARLELKGHGGYVNAVAISPDGTRLVSSSWDKEVHVWDLATGAPVQRLEGHGGLINPVGFSPDGRMLASGLGDRDIAIWNPETGERLRKLTGHQDKVYALAFSPDGRRLATAGHDKQVRIWDAGSGAELGTLPGHADLVTGLDWSPDGRWIATSGADAVAILWDAAEKAERMRLTGHRLWVNSVRFSPDSQLVATASDDRTVWIWSVASGEPRLILRTDKEVMALRFGPDGEFIFLGDDDRVVRYALDFSSLRADPEKLLAESQRASGRVLDGFELRMAAP